MLKRIAAALTSGPLSVRMSRALLTVVDVSNGRRWEDEPLLSLTGSKKLISAVGSAARSTSGELVNPFEHPRVFVADFLAGEKLLQYAFRYVARRSLLRPTPTVVLQITEALDGGISMIKRRALREIAMGAGAHQVYIVEGAPLTDAEIRAGKHMERDIDAALPAC